MPTFVRDALLAGHLREAYEARPPYQPNDYLGWIGTAKRTDTKQRRQVDGMGQPRADVVPPDVARPGQDDDSGLELAGLVVAGLSLGESEDSHVEHLRAGVGRGHAVDHTHLVATETCRMAKGSVGAPGQRSMASPIGERR